MNLLPLFKSKIAPFLLGLCISGIMGNFKMLRTITTTKGLKKMMKPSIICFGDSLTQMGFNPSINGWIANLQNFYIRKATVVNLGFSGYNTRWLKLMIKDTIPVDYSSLGSDILFTTIFLGANDAALKPSVQHVPLNEYRENLMFFVDHLREVKKDMLIVLITPPPVNERMWGDHRRAQNQVLDRSNAVAKQYVDICIEVAEVKNVLHLNIWELLSGFNEDQSTYEKYLTDGLHLSSSGNEILFQELKKLILLNNPDLDPEKLKNFYPHWSENPRNPESMKPYLA